MNFFDLLLIYSDINYHNIEKKNILDVLLEKTY